MFKLEYKKELWNKCDVIASHLNAILRDGETDFEAFRNVLLDCRKYNNGRGTMYVWSVPSFDLQTYDVSSVLRNKYHLLTTHLSGWKDGSKRPRFQHSPREIPCKHNDYVYTPNNNVAKDCQVVVRMFNALLSNGKIPNNAQERIQNMVQSAQTERTIGTLICVSLPRQKLPSLGSEDEAELIPENKQYFTVSGYRWSGVKRNYECGMKIPLPRPDVKSRYTHFRGFHIYGRELTPDEKFATGD